MQPIADRRFGQEGWKAETWKAGRKARNKLKAEAGRLAGRLEGRKAGRLERLEGWRAGRLEGWKAGAGGRESLKAGGLEGWSWRA